MAENKKTFIFYSDWINMIKEMPDKDAGQLLKHILSYVNDEDPMTDNILVKMAFGHMKPMLKSDLEKWEKQLTKFSEMGKASAKKRAELKVEPTLTYVEPTSTVNVNVNVNDNVNDNILEIYPTFEDFWNLYDHKVNAKKVKVKWGKLKQVEKEQTMLHVPLYIQSTPDKKFRKHPLTYLNNQGWTDEIIKNNGLTKKGKSNLTEDQERYLVSRKDI